MTDYSNLRNQLLNDLSKDKNVQQSVSIINKKLKTGKATFNDVTKLAVALSKPTSKGLSDNVPVGDMVAYAEEVVAPVYTASQRTVLAAGKKVQKGMLKRANLGIEPADVLEDKSRIVHIVGRFRAAESIDTVAFLLGEDVAENILRGAVTDTISENARNLNNMGFETYVTRSDGAGCCDWCASKVGTYKIGDLPDDFWAVHKGCSCTFEYKTKDTHSRIAFETNDKGKMKKVTEEL